MLDPYEIQRATIAGQGARSRWARGLLGAVAAIDVIAIVAYFGQLALLRSALGGAQIAATVAAGNDARVALLGQLRLLAFVLTAVAFLVWLHSAFNSLRLLGSPTTHASPTWAVGCWFVPFVNLVAPYLVVKEAWLRSATRSDSVPEKAASGPPIVGLWWTAYLVYNGLYVIAANWTGFRPSLERLASATKIGIAAEAASACAAILAILVVSRIANNLRAASESVALAAQG